MQMGCISDKYFFLIKKMNDQRVAKKLIELTHDLAWEQIFLWVFMVNFHQIPFTMLFFPYRKLDQIFFAI